MTAVLNSSGVIVKVVSTTNVALTGLLVIDGYQTLPGDPVLLVGQTAPAENGPWLTAVGAWSRPTDFTTGTPATPRLINVAGGTANAGTVWTLSTTGLTVVGSTAQTWVNTPIRPGGITSGMFASGAVVAAIPSGTYVTVLEVVTVVAASGAARTIQDPSTGTISRITLTANCAFTFPAASTGKSFTVVLVQDATGSRLATWPGTARWPGGAVPVLSTAAAAVDYLAFACTDGATWDGFLSGLDLR